MDWLGRAGGVEKAEAPYSAVTNSRKLWEYHLEKHQREVVNVHSCVDHSVPKCHDPGRGRVQENSRRFHVSERQAEIGRENRKLVDRLASISTRKCGGGSGGPPPGASRSSSQPPVATGALHEPLRRRISNGIQQDNEQLVKRILAVKTNMNIRGMERDFKKHQKYSQNLRRMPESPPRRGRKPRSLPPLHERMHPMSDPLRPPEGLLLPGDLCRFPSDVYTASHASPLMPLRNSQSASTLKEPLPRPEATDSDDNVSPMAATEPLPSLPGSPGPGPSRDSPGARPGGSPTVGGGASGRPPRPESDTLSKKNSPIPPVAAPLTRLESRDSEHSNQSWQQHDKETERRSWVAQPSGPEASSPANRPSPGKRPRPRPEVDKGGDDSNPFGFGDKDSMNKSHVSGTSELQYEDDWDEWSQDSPAKPGSRSQSGFNISS